MGIKEILTIYDLNNSSLKNIILFILFLNRYSKSFKLFDRIIF